jgi:hypothetical protein
MACARWQPFHRAQRHIERFQVYRRRHDPSDRFYTDYFRALFDPQG